jgi:catechol 2,3-dioxygenase-like lactoylglutathione lyase family enzyme
MKRLHLHVGVADLDASIRFYSTLFSAEPTVSKPDYAKWMLEDPRVNFAISIGNHARKGVEHLGIQVESSSELQEVHGRLKSAGGPLLEEGRTTCCYAQSEKNWTSDPDGLVWETFYTDGEAATYGADPGLDALSDETHSGGCCAPSMAPKSEISCCGNAA